MNGLVFKNRENQKEGAFNAMEKDEELKMDTFYHLPILVRQVMDMLSPAPGKVILDGTLGGGGHSEQFLEAGARVIGLDRDPEALAYAEKRLGRFGSRFSAVEGNFADAARILDDLGIQKVDGALLDLGVSSHQLDDPRRGFSFRETGPLDMRMSAKGTCTAADLVNHASTQELAEIFLKYGEEPRASQIAHRIAEYRCKAPLKTTEDLLTAIGPVLPWHSVRHPATKVFMALRIAVNQELESLSRGLESIASRLGTGAVFAVISFHSLEDRIVKNFFRDRSREWVDRPEWPAPRRNPEFSFRLLTTRPVEADEEEVNLNPRARSAKLRAAAHL